MNRLHRHKVPFQGKRAVFERRISMILKIAIQMETVPAHKRINKFVQQTDGAVTASAPRIEGSLPAETVADPLPRSEKINPPERIRNRRRVMLHIHQLQRPDSHQMGVMPVGFLQELSRRNQQSFLRINRQRRQTGTHLQCLLRQRGLPCGISQFSEISVETQKQSLIEVGVGRQKRFKFHVVNLRRRGQWQFQETVPVFFQERAEQFGNTGTERQRFPFQKILIQCVTPMVGKHRCQPDSVHRRKPVLRPSAERSSRKRSHTRHCNPRTMIKIAGKVTEFRKAFRQIIEKTFAAVKIPAGKISDITEFRVQIMVKVSTPRRQGTVIGGPDPLQRHRRRSRTGSRAVKIAAELIVTLQADIRQSNPGTPPESPPPCTVPVKCVAPAGNIGAPCFSDLFQFLKITRTHNTDHISVPADPIQENPIVQAFGTRLQEVFDISRHSLNSRSISQRANRLDCPRRIQQKSFSLIIRRNNPDRMQRNGAFQVNHIRFRIDKARDDLCAFPVAKHSKRTQQIKLISCINDPGFQLQFNPSHRKFRSRHLIGKLLQFNTRSVISAGDSIGKRFVVPARVPADAVISLIPEIAAVKRQFDFASAAPEQNADQTVAERNRLIPAIYRTIQLQTFHKTISRHILFINYRTIQQLRL